jgi:segregation and condensation protein A
MERLRDIMLEVLNKKPADPRPRAVMARDTSMTLADRLMDFRERLQRRGRFSFRRMLAECKTRVDVVVSFLAILELIRSGECDAEQEGTWGDIVVVALVKV